MLIGSRNDQGNGDISLDNAASNDLTRADAIVTTQSTYDIDAHSVHGNTDTNSSGGGSSFPIWLIAVIVVIVVLVIAAAIFAFIFVRRALHRRRTPTETHYALLVTEQY